MVSQPIFCAILLLSLTYASSLFQSNEYAEHDEVLVYVNSITSSKTQIVLDYYSLPVCKPDKVFQLKQNIGNVLSGEEYSNTKYSFRMMENQPQPQLLCKVKLTEDDVSLLKTRIEEEYNVQWIVDDLPAASVVSVNDDGSDYWFEDTHPIGYIDGTSHIYYNHLAFTISYHKSSNGKSRIVGVRVIPASIDYVETDGKLMARNKLGHMSVDGPTEVLYTYSVKFEESDIDYGSRWDLYLYGNTRKNVHWFSLTNSLFMVLFLSTVVGIIILRTLSRDISRYNSITEDERVETVEDRDGS